MGNGVFLLGLTISPKTLQELRQLWNTRLLGFNHQDFPGFKKSLLFTTPDSEKTFGNTSRFRKHLWLIPCVVLAIPFQEKTHRWVSWYLTYFFSSSSPSQTSIRFRTSTRMLKILVSLIWESWFLRILPRIDISLRILVSLKATIFFDMATFCARNNTPLGQALN